MMLKFSCARESRRPTSSGLTASFPIIRDGRSSSTRARFGRLSPSTTQQCLTSFGCHGWGRSWRDGVSDCVHYHSRTLEVLGAARGSGQVRFGGKNGRAVTLKAGDVAILRPVRNINASRLVANLRTSRAGLFLSVRDLQS